ncbi:unnamed protein product [Prorocentrum cordatum]|uniref:Uncharacterized protein n=1 Tax=Prorocentrum cordatum TaxID=2364126 RepID=A0ABN9VVX4_9DINO|nr:unnamed protein product [Polarella glacialis]
MSGSRRGPRGHGCRRRSGAQGAGAEAKVPERGLGRPPPSRPLRALMAPGRPARAGRRLARSPLAAAAGERRRLPAGGWGGAAAAALPLLAHWAPPARRAFLGTPSPRPRPRLLAAGLCAPLLAGPARQAEAVGPRPPPAEGGPLLDFLLVVAGLMWLAMLVSIYFQIVTGGPGEEQLLIAPDPPRRRPRPRAARPHN